MHYSKIQRCPEFKTRIGNHGHFYILNNTRVISSKRDHGIENDLLAHQIEARALLHSPTVLKGLDLLQSLLKLLDQNTLIF